MDGGCRKSSGSLEASHCHGEEEQGLIQHWSPRKASQQQGNFCQLENMNIYEPGLKKPLRNLGACEHPTGKRRPSGSKRQELARCCCAHRAASPARRVRLGKDVITAGSVHDVWGARGHKAKVVTSLTSSHLTPPSPGSRSWVTTIECGRNSHFSQIWCKCQGLEETSTGWVFHKQKRLCVGHSTCTTRARRTQLGLQHLGKMLHCKLPTCVQWAGVP